MVNRMLKRCVETVAKRAVEVGHLISVGRPARDWLSEVCGQIVNNTDPNTCATLVLMRPPEISEYQSYFRKYVSLVQGDDLTEILDHQLTDSLVTLTGISEAKSLHRYDFGKWSIKEVLGHLIDSERIFTYRALRFARNDQTPLEGFDQDPYVVGAGFDERPWGELVAEFEHVRRATILFFRGLKPEAQQRFGVANNAPITVRALGYVIAGHELHHLGILREKYL